MMRVGRVGVVLAVAVSGLVPTMASAEPDDKPDAEPVVVDKRVTMPDGVELQTTLTTRGTVEARPTVVEFSPYGDDSQSLEVGPEYNFLLVQIRGTGDSDGSFDALGPKTQSDVVDVLRWACEQPFSDGRLALNGFSASAITAYNSWHQELPCVKAAIMKSGTHELYRDLLVPGGINNLLPGAGVVALIGAPALLQGPERLARDPLSALGVIDGLLTSGLSELAHPRLDGWWQKRGWRGDANDIPVLVINGFFDVESRGAFQAYQALRDDGAHLLMAGGHDGVPEGTDGGAAEAAAWLDHYVRGVDNGVEARPRVQLTYARGSREQYLAGDIARLDAEDWPVPGTTWQSLALGADGSLSATALPRARHRTYATIPSVPTMTDVPNGAIVGASGLDLVTETLPFLTQTNLAGGLSFTTDEFTSAVDVVGPLSLELPLRTSTPGSAIWAVLSDVAPDGSAHPITVGRLSTTFPGVVEEKSLRDASGRIVQPYGDYTSADAARIGEERRYHVELWPAGNRFEAGHRLRLQLVGLSLASMPTAPALHTVRLGGDDGAKLLVPVLPGSNEREGYDAKDAQKTGGSG